MANQNRLFKLNKKSSNSVAREKLRRQLQVESLEVRRVLTAGFAPAYESPVFSIAPQETNGIELESGLIAEGEANDVTVLEDNSHVFSLSDFPAVDEYGNPAETFYLHGAGGYFTAHLHGKLLLHGQEVQLGAGSVPVTRDEIISGALVYQPVPNDPFQDPSRIEEFYYTINQLPPGQYYFMQINLLQVNDQPITQDVARTILEEATYAFESSDFPFNDGDGYFFGHGDYVNDSYYYTSPLESIVITSLPYADHGELTLGEVPAFVGQEISNAQLENLKFRHLDYTDPNPSQDTNPKHFVDVNGDGLFTDIDALIIINILNGFDRPPGTYPDTNKDGYISPIDAHLVLYHLQYYGDAAAGFQFRVKDSGGTAYGGVDISESAAFGFHIIPVNDAPVGSDVTRYINEDSGAYAFQSYDFPYSDPHDLPGQEFGGVKITSLPDPAQGALTQNGIPVASDTDLTALQITQLRFIPAQDFNGAISFHFRVFDETYNAGGGNPFGGDPSGGNEGPHGIDTQDRTFTFQVQPVNDAPVVLDNSLIDVGTTTEDSINGVGWSVASLLNFGGLDRAEDIDGDELGIAVTYSSIWVGQWEYSLDSGNSWTDVGDTLTDGVVLLGPQNRVRYQPNEKQGITNTRLGFRVWDQTEHGIGDRISIGPWHTESAFSLASLEAKLAVDPINDAPFFQDLAARNLGSITEDEIIPSGIAVSSFVGVVQDVDFASEIHPSPGIAVTDTSGAGTWQYQHGTSGTWIPIGSVSETVALLLPGDWNVRFVPNGVTGTTAQLTFKAWDRPDNFSDGALTSTLPSGGVTHFSLASVAADLTVTDVNDAPTASDIPNLHSADGTRFATDGDAPPVDMNTFFSDPDGDILQFTATTLPPYLTISSDGLITGQLGFSASATSPYSVIVTATDPSGISVTGSFTWNVYNEPPDAQDDQFSVAEDMSFQSASGFLLSNDMDSNTDGDNLMLTEVNGDANLLNTQTPGSHGGLFTINAAGDISFDPNGEFEGLSQGLISESLISYTVTDSQQLSSTAQITASVVGVNDAPTSITIPDRLDLMGSFISWSMAEYFSDVDAHDTHVYQAVNLPQGLSLHSSSGNIQGYISSYDDEDVTITFTDNHGASTSQSFHWIINAAPNAPDVTVSNSLENSIASGNVLTNATDADGDSLVVSKVKSDSSLVGQSVRGFPKGFFVIQANGDFTFDPEFEYDNLAYGETASTHVSFRVADIHGAEDPATLTVEILGLNDPPEAETIPDQWATIGQSAAIDLTDFFSDVDNGAVLIYSVDSLPPGLSLDATTGLITGILPVTASDSYSSVVTATDEHGASASEVMTIRKNTKPTATTDFRVTDEDNGLLTGDVITGQIFAGDGTSNPPDVDPEGDALTVTQVNGQSSNVGSNVAATNGGQVTIYSTGYYVFNLLDDFDDLSLGQQRVTTVEYRVEDPHGGWDTAQIHVTVTGENDGPTSSSPIPQQSSQDGSSVILDISSYFSDPDAGDTLSYSASNLPLGLQINQVTGVISDNGGGIDHLASQSSPYSSTITAIDPHGLTISSTFQWVVTNPAPDAIDDIFFTDAGFAISENVLQNDIDDDPLTVSRVNSQAANVGMQVPGSNGGQFTINADGSFVFVPGTDFDDLAVGDSRDTEVTYTAQDVQGLEDDATLRVTVRGSDGAPPIANQNNEDFEQITPLDVSGNFNGFGLSFTAQGLPPDLTISAAGVISGRLHRSASVNSPYTVTVTATDAFGQQTSKTFVWTVTNPVPVANDDAYTANQVRTISGDVLANDTDEDPLIVSLVNGVSGNVGASTAGSAGGTFSIQQSGLFLFDAGGDFDDLGQGQLRTTSIVYTADDQEGGSASATLVVTVVGPLNARPTSADVERTIDEDSIYSFVATDFPFSDADAGDSLTSVRIPSLPDAGVLYVLDPTSTPPEIPVAAGEIILVDDIADLRYAPAPDGFGNPYTRFDFAVSDGKTYSTNHKFTFIVTPVADSPIAVNDRYLAIKAPDTPLRVSFNRGLLANDYDVDSTLLTVSQLGSTPAGSGTMTSMTTLGAIITWTTDGAFTYEIPASAFDPSKNSDHFNYWVTDGTLTDPATVHISLVAPTTLGLPPLQDAFVRSDQPFDNFGDETILRTSGELGAEHAAILMFDLSSVRGDITDVELNLKAELPPTNTADHTWEMSELEWDETLMRWVDLPFGFAATGTASQSTPGEIALNVSQAVREAVALGTRYASFTIRHDGTFPIDYASNQHSNAALRPYLSVSGGISSNAPPTPPGISSTSIFENSGVGTFVIPSRFTDSNIDSVFHWIAEGNPNDMLAINRETGLVTVNDAKLLDHEITPNFGLVVGAVDSWGAESYASFAITVRDVNESPSIGNVKPMTVSNQAQPFTSIGFVPANDPDHDTLTYTIASGNIGGIFSLDANGRLLVTKPESIETRSYVLTVRVSDGEFETEGTVTINGTKGLDPAPTVEDEAEYPVSHKKKLTFNAAASFENKAGAENYAVTFKKSDGTFAAEGTPVVLTHGSLTANGDGTFTYDPDDDLLGLGTWSPVNDVTGRPIRFTLDEQQVEFVVITDLDANGQPNADATPVHSGNFTVQIRNDLPIFRGDLQHNTSTQDLTEDLVLSESSLEPSLFIDMTDLIAPPLRAKSHSYVVDLNELFVDPDGDIIDVQNMLSITGGVTSDPNEVTVSLGAVLSSNRELKVANLGDGMLQISHDVRWSDNFNANAAGYQFQIDVTDGQHVGGEPLEFRFTLPVKLNYVSPASSVDLALKQDPAVVTVTRFPDELPSTPVVDAQEWSVSASDMRSTLGYQAVQLVGETPVELRNGRLLLSHTTSLDSSGGNAEVSPAGFVYDSQLHNDEAPVIHATLKRQTGANAPTKITARLVWKDHRTAVDDQITTVTYDPNSLGALANQNEFLLAIQPDVQTYASGVYKWDLEVEMEFHSAQAPGARETYVWTTAGESTVVANRRVSVDDFDSFAWSSTSDRSDFGNGWNLAGMPTLTADKRVAGPGTDNSRIVVAFPGQPPRIFHDPSASNWSFSSGPGHMHSITHSTDYEARTEFGALEYNQLDGTDKFVYTSERGTEYKFQRFDAQTAVGEGAPRFLLVEVDPINAPPMTIQRNPVEDTTPSPNGLAYGSIESITFSDGSTANATAWEEGSVRVLQLPGSENNQSREITFTYDSDGNLTEISQNNFDTRGGIGPGPGVNFDTPDRVRKFVYDGEDRLTAAQWIQNGSQTAIERSQNFGYSPLGQLNQIKIGEDSEQPLTYDIETLASVGLSASSTNLPLTSLRDLRTSVRQGSDLHRYDAGNPTTGVSLAGTHVEETVYSRAGLPTLVQSYYEYGNQKYDPVRTETRHDFFGSARTSVLRDTFLSYDTGGLFTPNRELEDESGRDWTYFEYDYDTPLSYESNSDDTGTFDPNQPLGTDATAKYDPTDFRGNPTKIRAVNGTTTIEYETDDEVAYFKGLPYRTVSIVGTTADTLFDTKGRPTRVFTPRVGQADYLETWVYYEDNSGFNNSFQLQTHTNPLGLETTYQYDNRRRLQTEEILDDDSDSVRTQFFYNNFGNLDEVVLRQLSSNQVASRIRNVFDAVGFLRESTSEDWASSIESMSQLDYDADGQLTESRRYEVQPFGGGADVVSTTTSEIDTRGLVTSSTAGDSAQNYPIVYDDSALPAFHATMYEYYSDGSPKSITAPQKIIKHDLSEDDIQTFFFANPGTRETWTVQTGLATKSEVAADLNVETSYTNAVARTKLDSWGRTIEQEDLLTGAQTTFEYGDYRFDTP
ncbi:MAG: Ig-like domain-containing protein, partial [Planctomycetota bacterium]